MKAKNLTTLFLLLTIAVLAVSIYRLYFKKLSEGYCPHCMKMIRPRGWRRQGCPYANTHYAIPTCNCPCATCRRDPANCPMSNM